MNSSPDSSAPPVYSIVGDRYVFLVTGAQTGGAYATIEAHVPTGGGPPPHVHRREDEAFQVLMGEFEFDVAGKSLRLHAGEFLFARRDVPHRFQNVGPTEGRMLITVTPAGLENFFAEIGTRLASRDDAPIPPSAEDVARLLEAAPKYGLEMIPPH